MKNSVLAVLVAAYAVCGLITYVEPCNPYLHVCDGAAVIAGNLTVNWLYASGSNLSGSAYDDSALWSNASNQDGRIIALEGVDYSPFFNNVTGNISELWANNSNQDGRIIGLEGVKSVYETSKVCPAGQFMNGSNTTNIDCGVIAAGATYYDDRWIIDGGIISSNITKGGGTVNVTGSLIGVNSHMVELNVTSQIVIGGAGTFSQYGGEGLAIKKDAGYQSVLELFNSNANGVSGVSFYNLSGAWIGIFGYDNPSKRVIYQNQAGTNSYYAATIHYFAGQIYTTSNKGYNLGQIDPSFDSAYADDWVNTFRVLPSLAKNNAKDFDIKTTAIDESKSGGIGVLRVDVADKKVGDNAKIYGSYLDVLKDIPFNESTGETDIRNIPMMLRDKWYNQDSLSTAAYLNTLRGALFEKDAEITALKARLDKLEGVKP